MSFDFIPINSFEVKKKGWESLDIILISGDAYVDHPSFGTAIIARILEKNGFKVGIIPQPNWREKESFKVLGKPKLFFGITAGSLDSMVANYTPNKIRRREDAYSEGGVPGKRPDRATLVYANIVHELYPDIPIILGGIEASLRRFSHYDFWEDRIRHSILLESRAKILVYGMGEKQIIEIAKALAKGACWEEIFEIPGIVFSINEKEFKNFIRDENYIILPSFEEVEESKEKYHEFQNLLIKGLKLGKRLIQKDGKRLIIQNPPPIYTSKDLDYIYSLPFTRKAHPSYRDEIPALKTVQTSITSHRGCFGSCTFCSLNLHQGWQVIERSEESIMREIKWLVSQPFFRGTITDIGGPTANMYGLSCKIYKIPGSCPHRDCLYPDICPNLIIDFSKQLKLLKDVKNIPKVKHVFIASGIRYDLALKDPYYIREIIREGYIGGHLSVAPEHVDNKVLEIMRKPKFEIYEKFVVLFNQELKRQKKELYIIPYFISSHPGADLKSAWSLAMYVKSLGHYLEQIQDYTPLPLTPASCAFYTELHPFRKEKIYVAKSQEERRLQRALVQYKDRKNRDFLLKNKNKIPFPLEELLY